MNKYEIAEDLTLGDPLMCLMGDEDATKKVICKAMEYIEENQLKMPSYSRLANVILVSDEDKENTIAIQRHAVKEAGYTGWGGVHGDGPLDGPNRDLFAMSMAGIQVMGWEKWIASLLTKEQRKKRKKRMEETAEEWVKEELEKHAARIGKVN